MSIIQIKGNVQYKITIDPSVWILMTVNFNGFIFEKSAANEEQQLDQELDQERVIREGQTLPPTLKHREKYEKERLVTGSFGMKLGDMIKMQNRSNKRRPVNLSQKQKQLLFRSLRRWIALPISAKMESL